MATTKPKPARKTKGKSKAATIPAIATVAKAPVTGLPAAATSPRTRRLDARPDRADFRDLPYRPPLRSLEPTWPSDAEIAHNLTGYIKAGLIRDQGDQGACTGFGLACVANYLLWVRHVESKSTRPFESVSPRMFFELARRYDEWPGVDYEWSSCRGALKGWNKHGVCADSTWPYPLDKHGTPQFVQPAQDWEREAARRPLGVYYRVDKDSIVDVQAALNDIGAVYASADAHDGWDALLKTRKGALPASHASLPRIEPVKSKKSLGGHAFALVGYNETGFVVQNSWGEVWGARGFAVLPYEDWLEHCSDAWVCALGVPITVSAERLALTRFRVPAGQSLGKQARTPQNPDNKPDDPWPIDHPYTTIAYQPWSTADAYAHTLVSGNDGALIASDVTFRFGADPSPYADETVLNAPLAWFAKQPAGDPAKLMIYAHGGLNSEDESIRRIRVLAPYADANGIYPLFLTWKTGPIETLTNIFTDYFSKQPEIAIGAGGVAHAIREGADRLVEATSHLILRGIWSEMRENAAASVFAGRTLDLLATRLVVLRDRLQATGRRLDIHLVGHSAGSILLGKLLERMLEPPLLAVAPPVKSCTLFAAACSVQFAIGTYGKAAQTPLFDLRRLWLHYLVDQNEDNDGLPTPSLPIYGKSLLYLVSRALDDARKMPLLGMEKAVTPGLFDPDDWDRDQAEVVRSWQELWTPDGPGNARRGVTVTAPDVAVTKTGATIPATHGSFDNNIDVLTATLERIRGAKLIAPMEWLDY